MAQSRRHSGDQSEDYDCDKDENDQDVDEEEEDEEENDDDEENDEDEEEDDEDDDEDEVDCDDEETDEDSKDYEDEDYYTTNHDHDYANTGFSAPHQQQSEGLHASFFAPPPSPVQVFFVGFFCFMSFRLVFKHYFIYIVLTIAISTTIT